MAEEWKEYLNRLNTASTEVFSENTSLKEEVLELQKEGENWRKEKLDLLQTQGELLDKVHVLEMELKESTADSGELEQARKEANELRSKLDAEVEGKSKLEGELEHVRKEVSDLKEELKREVEGREELVKKLMDTFENGVKEEEVARKSFHGAVKGIIFAGISGEGGIGGGGEGGGQKRTQQHDQDDALAGNLGEGRPSKRARTRSNREHPEEMEVIENSQGQAKLSVTDTAAGHPPPVEPLLLPVSNILHDDDGVLVLDDVMEHGIGGYGDKDLNASGRSLEPEAEGDGGSVRNGMDANADNNFDLSNSSPSGLEVNTACHRNFDLLMQIPLGDLLGDRNILFVFPPIFSIEDVALSIFSTLAQTTAADQAKDELVEDERLTKGPLILRFATVLAILRKLAKLYPEEYLDLPREFCRVFCQKIVNEEEGMGWMENEQLLSNLGGFFAAMHSLMGDGVDVGVRDVILTFGGVKGPLLYSFLYWILLNDFGVLGFNPGGTSWGDLPLWVRSVLVVVYRNPSFNNSTWKGKLTELLNSKGVQDLIPEGAGFNGFFEMMLREVCMIDGEEELVKAAKVVGMMVAQRGWIWFREVVQVLLNKYDVLLREGKINERGLGEGVLKGFGLGISWMRKENQPENLDNVKSQFVRFREARFSQTIRDAANYSLSLMDKVVLRLPNENPAYWQYAKKDGGRKSQEKKLSKKDSTEKPKKKRMSRK